MARDPIRNELMDRTGWSTQSITNRIKPLTRYMSRRHALLLLAVENGVELERHGIDSDTIVEVGRLIREQEGGAPAKSGASGDPSGESKKSTNRSVSFKSGGYDGPVPPSMTGLVSAGHQRSGEAYPALSIFENSIRELIRRVLEDKHGPDWWDKAVAPKIQKKAERYMDDDQKDPWHEPRGDHPLSYVGFWDYTSIITDDKNWPLFEPILDRKSFVSETLRAVNVSRRVIAHNHALSRDDKQLLEPTITKWLKHLAAHDDLIP